MTIYQELLLSQWFCWMNSLCELIQSYNNAVVQVLLLAHFTDEEIEPQNDNMVRESWV